MLNEKRDSFIRRVDLHYIVKGHGLRPESSAELRTVGQDIKRAEAHLEADQREAAKYPVGFLHLISLAALEADRLTMAQLRLAKYSGKYGLAIPADVKMPPLTIPAVAKRTTFLPAADSTKEAGPPGSHDEVSPFAVRLISKNFQDADPDSGVYQQFITFKIDFKNQTKKNIRAFDGILSFTDLLGNPILSSSLAINDPIAAGTDRIFERAMEYNEFMGADRELRAESTANIKVRFSVKKVLFDDGTTKVY